MCQIIDIYAMTIWCVFCMQGLCASLNCTPFQEQLYEITEMKIS